MKRFIVAFVFMMFGLALSAQVPTSAIIMNGQDPETRLRSLGTESKTVRNGLTDEHPLELALLALETPAGWQYSITVTVAESISRPLPENGLLLLKTTTGEVIELTNHCDALTSQDFEGDLVPGTSSFIYRNLGGYSATMDQLIKIGREGVQKLRIQTSSGYYETVYKKEQWGGVMTAHIRAIQGEIRKNKDIRSDF